MRKKKLSPGDFIRLETRHGAIEVKVRADRDVPENMVFMPFCYAEAAANLLINPALDPFGKIPKFKFCAARAEPAEIRTAATEWGKAMRGRAGDVSRNCRCRPARRNRARSG
jgi:formate dehydrogenase major subunit